MHDSTYMPPDLRETTPSIAVESTYAQIPSKDTPCALPLWHMVLQKAIEHQATDIHIMQESYTFYRIGGCLISVVSRETEMNLSFTHTDISKIITAYDLQENSCRLVPWEDYQLRLLYIRTNTQSPLLVVRIQSRIPPMLSTSLASHPLTDRLYHPRGLVMVTGGIGQGKTTLASSLCVALADAGRHLFTIEDPVEYHLALARTEQRGTITQVNVTERNSFQELAALALRADIDVLMIGEVRNSATLKVAIQAASTHAPCITTMHSGGFSDCIVRLQALLQEEGMAPQAAAFLIAESLFCILHIQLGFTDLGEPVPVVAMVPIWRNDALKQLILTNDICRMSNYFSQFTQPDELSVLSYAGAMDAARQRGATEESLQTISIAANYMTHYESF